ncbi:MAG: hypothetical protein HQ588_00840 [Deltaproteobacteria bacterium]|nr:hypothetical protein [Deltaproteobacteria bacterium]
MSILKIAVASVLVLSLVLGLALPALADSDEPLPWAGDSQARIVRGTVTEVDEENQAYFKVQSGEDEIDIRVDENTGYFMLDVPGPITALAQQFRLRNQAEVGTPEEQGLRLRLRNQAEVGAQVEPGMGLGLKNRVRAGALVSNQARLRAQNQVAQTEDVPLPEPQQTIRRPFGEKAEFSDIEVGDRVVVWLADGESLARWVLIIKPATCARVSGTITALSSETIEITPDDSEAVTLHYNEDTVFVLNGFIAVEEGQLARAAYESENMLAERVNVSLAGD